MAGDRRRGARARLRTHRIRQDAGGVPVGARPAERRGCARRSRRRHARGVREPVEGAGLRHRAQPPRPHPRDRRDHGRGRRARGQRRHPHRRHAPARARGHGAQPAGHPHHHPRVALSDPHLPGAGDAERGRGGDRGRDPRRCPLKARLAPGAHAGAPGGPGRRCGAADRPQRDPEPARGDRALPGGSPPAGQDRRRRCAEAARPAHRGAGGVDDRTRRSDRPRARPADARRGRRVEHLDLAGDLPRAARARAGLTTRPSSSSTTAARPSAWHCG